MTRQSFHGIVTAAGIMSKTIRVRVNTRTLHPIYKKVLNIRKDYMVHDEGEICASGDVVRIEACRPMSKRKHFALAELLQRRNLGPLDAKANTQ